MTQPMVNLPIITAILHPRRAGSIPPASKATSLAPYRPCRRESPGSRYLADAQVRNIQGLSIIVQQRIRRTPIPLAHAKGGVQRTAAIQPRGVEGMTLHLAGRPFRSNHDHMKKQLPLYIYGAILVLLGVFLIFSAHDHFLTLKYTLGTATLVAAYFAFKTAFSRQRTQVQFAYHEMHALAILVYGVSVLFFCTTTATLVNYTTFLFVFYAFSEIIFFSWLFNMGQALVIKIAIMRALLGLAVGLGSAIAMYCTAVTFEVFGLLFIMVGVNIVLYVPVMKANQPTPTTKPTLK